MQRQNPGQGRTGNRLFWTLLLSGLVLLVILPIVALLALRGCARQEQPEAEPILEPVDARLVMEHAAEYGVSLEYLQILLPDYVIYRDGPEYVFTPIDNRLELHDYDWSCLSYDFGRRRYNDGRAVTYGVDVSLYQEEIDWAQVAADDIDFAMIRVGYRGYTKGGLEKDPRAEANLSGAAAAGLKLGAYFFSQAVTVEEAEEEAQLVLDALAGYEVTYPVVFDMEEVSDEARTDSLTVQQRTDIAEAFCRVIEKAGYQPMIYGNVKWLAGRLDLVQLRKYPLWLAQYADHPLFPYRFQMWQYSDSGEVAGIPGPVDLNICFTPYGE